MVRFALAASSVAAYVLSLPLLYPHVGSSVGALSFVPTIVVAWLYRLPGGVAIGIAISLVNFSLLPGGGSPFEWLVPTFATVFMGTFVGYASRLRWQLADQKQALLEASERDHLTGLLNRGAFEARVTKILSRSGQHALLYLDLDGFKAVNDTYGHATGDRLLRERSVRLAACVRSDDVVARIGGDEFAIAIPDVPSTMDVLRRAEHIVEALNGSASHEGTGVPITASIGIALAPRDGTTSEALLQAADQAMYQVKAAGRNGYRCSDVGPAEARASAVPPVPRDAVPN